MILTKQEIYFRIGSDIVIKPFDAVHLNPNSYNLSLGKEILVYKTDSFLDMKKDNPYEILSMDNDGLLLFPGQLYLAQTVEYTETRNLVPVISGRSSVGRLGLNIHATAGFGDIGFCGHWTLELSVVRPLRVYPGVRLCQVYFHEIKGSVEEYKGKYQGNTGVQPSMLWKELR